MSEKLNGHASKFSLTSVMPVRANDGAEMEIHHPVTFETMRNIDGSVASITMRGQTSKAFRRTVTEINRMRTDQQMTDEQIRDPQHIYDTDTMLLVACTVNWNFDELAPGEFLPYSEENAQKLWTDERFDFLRFRATAFMLNNGNFLPAPLLLSGDSPAISSESTSLSETVREAELSPIH
jgi:hypothetical protein